MNKTEIKQIADFVNCAKCLFSHICYKTCVFEHILSPILEKRLSNYPQDKFGYSTSGKHLR